MIMKVIWLDKNDREIGLGLCLISTRQPSGSDFLEWVPYVDHRNCTQRYNQARVLFSKTDSTRGFIEVDNVVLTRLI